MRKILIYQYYLKFDLNLSLYEQELLQLIYMKNIIFLMVILLSIVGCQKDDAENQISFKKDGEQIICNASILSNESLGNNGYPVLDLYGEFDFHPDGLHVEYIQITLWHFDEIKREYPIGIQVGSSISMYLQRKGDIPFYAVSGIVIIEELTDSYVKGTFECMELPGSESITITEGKFYLKRE